MINRRGQVTIFIIIAVVLVALVGGYFLLKDRLFNTPVPASVEPVYTKFLSCLQEDTSIGVDIMESQGGYIHLPDFEPGTSYMPFGSELNFLGNPIPYWYYVTGNNIEKEQVPTKEDMQNDLASFINEKIRSCNYDSYYSDGFAISQGEPKAKVIIKDNSVQVNLNMNLEIDKNNDTSIIKTHQATVETNLGKLYNDAFKIYNKEQSDLFLEEYAIDDLRLYAPVDGVELTCSPLVWNPANVFSKLQDGIVANTLALKNKNGDYKLANKDEQYFVRDLGVNEDVRFITSQNWSSSFEVTPTDGGIMIAKPVGNQAGLGALGFCYVAYHFVYNVKYPVLIQLYSGDEIFQFPMAVILQNNNPRKSLDVSTNEFGPPQLCQYKNNPMEVNIYDSNLNPVDAEVSYECFGSSCDIGKTKNGKLAADFPQCVNGYIETRADGFVDSKYLYSTTKEGSVDIILDRLYPEKVSLKLDGQNYTGDAIINIVGDKSSKTLVYPQYTDVNLSEGQYNIQVYIYKNSSLKFDATTHKQCVDVPGSGISGLLGVTDQKCFDINIPSQIISNALAGGGKQDYYILESELKTGSLEIDATSLPTPTSIDELQNNYIVFDSKNLGVNFG